MKLTVFLLMIAFVQVSAEGYGQITLHEKNAPFERVMASIRKQTNYAIVYNNRVKISKITIDIDNASIHETLDKCFKNLPITYKIIGNSIFLKEKEDDNPPAVVKIPEPAMLSTTVAGIIVNEQNRPIEGASILVKNSHLGTLTNSEGYFRLSNVEDNTVLRITCIGYMPIDIGIRKLKAGYVAYAIQKEQATNLKSDIGTAVDFTLRLVTVIADMRSVSVIADASKPKQIGTIVELKHRSHLNLGQVLEGSVPGLTLKSTTTTAKEFSVNSLFFLYGEPGQLYTGVERIRELYNKVIATNPTIRNQYPTFDSFYNEQFAIANNTPIPGFYETSTTTSSSGLVPELRGSSSFTGNSSGMLVVIDGIEQSAFPSNYPMVNVAKVEVIKDPAELIKWGPKATGGLILITTNGAKAGKLEFDYSSNFFYSGKPDISNQKLQLASSTDVLAYYKEQVERGLASYIPSNGDFSQPPIGLKPAQLILYNLKKNNLPYTDARFTSSWDSLATISNRNQLLNLYSNAFKQGHSLTMSGGTQNWNFSLGGSYNYENNKFSKASLLQLNLANRLNFLKNKLKITWQLNTSDNKNQQSDVDRGNTLDPYQLLLNPQQGYVYDYPNGNFTVNQAMQKLGYENNGVNALEDALNTKYNTKMSVINSLLNVNWDLSKSLQWATVFRYARNKNSINNLMGSATSQVRQLRNNYGSPDSLGGVKMYIPQGDILYSSNSNGLNWNLRSGLSYNHSFGPRNVVTAALGLGATHAQTIALPNANIYGYDPGTSTNQPLLTFPDQGIINYFGATQYLSSLQSINFMNASYDRSFSINGNLGYTYDNRYVMGVQYGSLFTPNVGFIPSYSGTKNYQAKASWLVNNEHFFKIPFISTLTLSAIASRIQLGKSPDVVASTAFTQPLWGNSALFASKYTQSQLNGQHLNNIGGALQIGLWQERVYIKSHYNYTSDGSHQINGQVAYAINREPWFKIPFVSTLVIDASIQNFNSLQAQAIFMGTNLPNANGEFSLASGTSFGILPPATINKEAHLTLGLFKDRLIFDTRYYHKIVSGISGSNLLTPDPSTGVASQLSYSRMLNKGIELYLNAKVVQRPNFSYIVSINGAYNINEALDIPTVPYTQLPSYLTAFRTGYATDALWSYRWAGLDNMGNPQVYKDINTKVPMLSGTDANGNTVTTQLDASYLVYSGRTTAPWIGGLNQEWNYKNFFATARLAFNFGHVMRTYIPIIGPELDKSILIGQRWQKPGDEANTDIAAMAQFSATRALVIQNSSNSIVSADNIRISEVQFGYEVPATGLKSFLIQRLTISASVRNLSLWTRNKLGLDPTVLRNNGMVGIQLPRQYILTINAHF